MGAFYDAGPTVDTLTRRISNEAHVQGRREVIVLEVVFEAVGSEQANRCSEEAYGFCLPQHELHSRDSVLFQEEQGFSCEASRSYLKPCYSFSSFSSISAARIKVHELRGKSKTDLLGQVSIISWTRHLTYSLQGYSLFASLARCTRDAVPSAQKCTFSHVRCTLIAADIFAVMSKVAWMRSMRVCFFQISPCAVQMGLTIVRRQQIFLHRFQSLQAHRRRNRRPTSMRILSSHLLSSHLVILVAQGAEDRARCFESGQGHRWCSQQVVEDVSFFYQYDGMSHMLGHAAQIHLISHRIGRVHVGCCRCRAPAIAELHVNPSLRFALPEGSGRR